jgi:hypothetical protein
MINLEKAWNKVTGEENPELKEDRERITHINFLTAYRLYMEFLER